MATYDHKKIEKKWQKKWEAEQPYRALDDSEKEKFYLLTEFPYPSGNLHVGHWYAFAVPDILARYQRMKGREVLYPIGFDAFGLPAENAAIQRKLNPRDWTYDNMAHMREQMRSMGASFDWSREVVTCDPKYYRWTQWQFLQFFRKGLAYRAEREVNWCPKDKTVLANEQVQDGHCERCGTGVIKKNMLQWNLRITDYADRLIDDLDALNWPEQIKDSQRNWIGRSTGAEISFELRAADVKTSDVRHIAAFTTRPDTLFGATYMVVAPEHEVISKIKNQIANIDDVEKYITEARKKTEIERSTADKEKTGVELKGVKAINPATQEEIPIFIADYVIGSYGTGAIMAVPAHDERDFAFANKFNLSIVKVIDSQNDELPYTGEGVLINSNDFDGLPSAEARQKITEKFGKKKTTYKLRDWVVSRQRYWGVPIPILHCQKCGPVAVPDDQLPVLLPEVDDYLPEGEGRSPLAKVRSFVDTECPQCGGKAERETDTLDTFVDSSWYYIRYTDPNNEKEFAAKDMQATWMPIDLYSGGSEHTTMHVLYSRFWHKALFDLGLVNESEPYTRRMNRGLIMGPDGQKMSKRWGNVVDPDEQVKLVGADTVRMYLAFIGPYNVTGVYPWNPGGVVGVRRFLERVWKYAELTRTSRGTDAEKNTALKSLMHKTIKKVGEDIESLKMNTAVSALMILLNAMEKECSKCHPPDAEFKIFLRLLAPFAPHITEELWEKMGAEGSIHAAPWPQYDESKIVSETVKIVIQVDGKTRGSVELPADSTQEDVEAAARAAMADRLAETEVIRVIFVPNRLINLVVSS